jgi:hypothetical protein
LNRLIIFVLVLFLSGCAGIKTKNALAADRNQAFTGPCHEYGEVCGKSFTFEGRTGFFNGNLTSLKIKMTGTRRVLGVRSGAPIPANLREIFKNGLTAQVYGIFTVYPCTVYKKGAMQFVCVESVKITRVDR